MYSGYVRTDLQRWGLSLRPFRLQLSALMVQWHWQDVVSSAHLLPLQGRQRGLGDGDREGEMLMRGGDGEEVEDGGAWVLDGRGVLEQCD